MKVTYGAKTFPEGSGGMRTVRRGEVGDCTLPVSGIDYEFLLRNAISGQKRTRVLSSNGVPREQVLMETELDTLNVKFTGKPFAFLWGNLVFKGPFVRRRAGAPNQPPAGDLSEQLKNVIERTDFFRDLEETCVLLPICYTEESRPLISETWDYVVYNNLLANLTAEYSLHSEMMKNYVLSYNVSIPNTVLSLRILLKEDHAILPKIDARLLLRDLVLLYILKTGDLTLRDVLVDTRDGKAYILDVDENTTRTVSLEDGKNDKNDYFYFSKTPGKDFIKKWDKLIKDVVPDVIDDVSSLIESTDRLELAIVYLGYYYEDVTSPGSGAESVLDALGKTAEVVRAPNPSVRDVTLAAQSGSLRKMMRQRVVKQDEVPRRSISAAQLPVAPSAAVTARGRCSVVRPGITELPETTGQAIIVSSEYSYSDPGGMQGAAGKGQLAYAGVKTFSSGGSTDRRNVSVFTVIVMKSALQKYIRRGLVDKALYVTTELWRLHEIRSYEAVAGLFKRLAVIALEDIGIAAPRLVTYAVSKCREWLTIREKVRVTSSDKLDSFIDFADIVSLVIEMCESKKTRSLSHIKAAYILAPEIALAHGVDYVDPDTLVRDVKREFPDEYAECYAMIGTLPAHAKNNVALDENLVEFVENACTLAVLLNNKILNCITSLGECFRLGKGTGLRFSRDRKQVAPIALIFELLTRARGLAIDGEKWMHSIPEYQNIYKNLEDKETFMPLLFIAVSIVYGRGPYNARVPQPSDIGELTCALLAGDYELELDDYVLEDKHAGLRTAKGKSLEFVTRGAHVENEDVEIARATKQYKEVYMLYNMEKKD